MTGATLLGFSTENWLAGLTWDRQRRVRARQLSRWDWPAHTVYVCSFVSQALTDPGRRRIMFSTDRDVIRTLSGGSSPNGGFDSVPRCRGTNLFLPNEAGGARASVPGPVESRHIGGAVPRCKLIPRRGPPQNPENLMAQEPGLSEPKPVIVVDLLPEILDRLLRLLSSLHEEEWDTPTICAGWSVKDVALHLLGVEIGNISSRRDRHHLGGTIEAWEQLVDYLNRWNQEWVEVARRTSPPLLIELLGFVGEKACQYFRSLDPMELGGSISWAGPERRPVWLDIAREYTERWHHQQHIRDAVDQPGVKRPKYLKPVLETFVWALPRAFRHASGPEGTSIMLSIAGDSGGNWTLLRGKGAWRFYQGKPEEPGTEILMEQDFAWRFFTKGSGTEATRKHIQIRGDENLAGPVFEMVSIIA